MLFCFELLKLSVLWKIFEGFYHNKHISRAPFHVKICSDTCLSRTLSVSQSSQLSSSYTHRKLFQELSGSILHKFQANRFKQSKQTNYLDGPKHSGRTKPNWNGPFHLTCDWNFQSLWHNGKHPNSHYC